MNRIITFICILSVNFLIYSQSPFYYTLKGEKIYLEFDQNRYLVHTNEHFQTTDFGKGNWSKLTDNYYTTDAISEIKSYNGIEYYTQGLLYNGTDQLLTSKDISLLFKNDVTESEKDQIYKQYSLTLLSSTSMYDIVRVPNSSDALTLSNTLYETGKFVFCSPDFWVIAEPAEYIPNDPYFNQQWYLHNTGQGTNDGHPSLIDADIDAPEAWDISKGDASIVIAVIDSGVSSDHPDLPNSRQIRLPGSNFAVNWDGTTNPDDPSPKLSTTCTSCNHGNSCAGVIAATHDNNEGIAGIAPLCKIMPVKIPFSSLAPLTTFSSAILFAVNNDANIISCSWNIGGIPLNEMEIAIQASINSNIPIVFCVGNTAHHEAGVNGSILYPANTTISDLIAVGASDCNNNLANYSPTSPTVDIVAPSHSFYSHSVYHPNESYNIWTLDIPGENYGDNKWRNAEHDWPLVGEVLPSMGTNFSSYTGRFGGTSAAAPMVAGVIALMKSVNPCLSMRDLHRILQQSSDKVGGYNYNWNPGRPGHSTELGYGKLNAYNAVNLARAMNTSVYDLYMKDNANDLGLTGGADGTGGGGDKSPDIWVRNHQNGLTFQTSENPEFDNNDPCYVYVRVTNKSCTPSQGNDVLKVYWSKAATSSSWPENWDGSSPETGNLIGEQTIPALDGGESIILEFEWNMLNPHEFNTWNSCLLARIESSSDYLTFYPVLADDITENNNVSIRNVTIVDNWSGLTDNQVLVGNVTSATQNSTIYFGLTRPSTGKPNIFEEAEITATFEPIGWQLITDAGILSNPGVKVIRTGVLRIMDSEVWLNNITFPAKTRIPILIEVHFLSDQKTDNEYYEFEISQYIQNGTTLKRLGTETFEVHKPLSSSFSANAGDDQSVLNNTETLIAAETITDPAIYNWYDESGNLIYTGSDFLMVQQITQKYKLEVIRLTDGWKDYDEVEINVEANHIKSISPVPADDQLTIEYDITGLSDAYISIVNSANGTSYNYILNENSGNTLIDISNWQTGIYIVHLISQGVLTEIKTITVL